MEKNVLELCPPSQDSYCCLLCHIPGLTAKWQVSHEDHQTPLQIALTVSIQQLRNTSLATPGLHVISFNTDENGQQCGTAMWKIDHGVAFDDQAFFFKQAEFCWLPWDYYNLLALKLLENEKQFPRNLVFFYRRTGASRRGQEMSCKLAGTIQQKTKWCGQYAACLINATLLLFSSGCHDKFATLFRDKVAQACLSLTARVAESKQTAFPLPT